VQVSIVRSGLYEWLFKVISVIGLIDGEEGEGVPNEEENKDRDREKDYKPMLGCRALEAKLAKVTTAYQLLRDYVDCLNTRKNAY
jgi:hypothetical protein